MTASDLERLREIRFPELLLTCERGENPGIVDAEEWRDWSAMPTTPDQLRIERYLDRFDLGGKRLLHIGVGNSRLAERFHREAAEIVGTTVVPAERRHGEDMGLPNYLVLLHNKYRFEGAPQGSFDFIVDNNPTTFGCCLSHVCSMFQGYARALAEGGQVVTDRVGLGWVSAGRGQDARWGFDFDDLAAIAALAGLQAYRYDADIYLLAASPPNGPGRLSGLASRLRRARRAIRRASGGS